jgi:hypothetical protein
VQGGGDQLLELPVVVRAAVILAPRGLVGILVEILRFGAFAT